MDFQIYLPYVCDINAVSSIGANTLVTTNIEHGFVVGNLVGFSIPKEYGMRELNAVKAYVLTVPTTTSVLLNLDSRNFTPFIIPTPIPTVVLDPAQIIPAGNSNSGYSAPGGVQPTYETIPGAYQAQIET